MSNDYTPRKKDEAFALPPVPPWVGRKVSLNDLIHYRHAVAAPLLARIAELEQSVQTFRAARDGYRDDAFRLSADKRALLQGSQEQASEINRLRAELAEKDEEVEKYRADAERSVDEIVTGLYRRFKDWSQRGFGPDDVTWCEVKADVIALIAARKAESESQRSCSGAEGDHLGEGSEG